MADALDVLSLAEGHAALNIASTDTSKDTLLASYITAVSRRLDEMCGAIVIRTVTAEQYLGGTTRLFLKQAPVSSTAATTIGTVTEYSGGTAQAVVAENLTTSSAYDYYFDVRTGMLSRRSSWADTEFAPQRVVVTYSPGRYANTAAVDQKFKQAASIMLAHLWTREQGVGGSATFGPSPDDELAPHYGLMSKQVAILLEGELLPPAVA